MLAIEVEAAEEWYWTTEIRSTIQGKPCTYLLNVALESAKSRQKLTAILLENGPNFYREVPFRERRIKKAIDRICAVQYRASSGKNPDDKKITLKIVLT